MGRKSAPIKIVMHYPEDEPGRKDLSRRVAAVHADAVNRQLQRLTCPTPQKLQLLTAIVKQVEKDQEDSLQLCGDSSPQASRESF